MNFGDALTAISRRFSHVGRRPALFEPALVNISIKPKPRSISRVFQQTPVVQKIVASGPLGVLSYPIHHGLTCQVVDGHVPTEKKLVVDLDKDAFDKMSKYKQKFVKSMWGTTASGLNRMIEGVSEVTFAVMTSFRNHFRDFKFLYGLLVLDIKQPWIRPESSSSLNLAIATMSFCRCLLESLVHARAKPKSS